MKPQDSHLSDQDLLLDLEGELAPRDRAQVVAHVDQCRRCRERRQELAQTLSEFVHVYGSEANRRSPSAAGARALLQARLARLSSNEAAGRFKMFWFAGRHAWGTALAGVLAVGLCVVPAMIRRHHAAAMRAVVSIPDSRLTPGATLLVSRRAVCSQGSSNNKTVPVALQRKVFAEYGISGADPRAYEVDYLVTPALGGADDIHNLWPHSYSATEWNAQVKDALENRLREMVCGGSLDLTEAQREIAENWIAAYKKYFHTDKPLDEHWK